MRVNPRWPLRTRLVALIALLIGAFSLLLYIYVPARVARQAQGGLVARARSIAQMTAFSVSPALVFRDAAVLEEGFVGATRNPDVVYVLAEDSAGALVAAHNAGAVDRGWLAVATAGEQAAERDGVMSVGAPIVASGRTIGRLYLGMSLARVREDVSRVRATVAVLSYLVFIIGLIAVVAISTLLTQPLRAMVATVERIAEGDRTHRAPVGGPDEVVHLAQAFNRMVDRLDDAWRQLEEANRTLEARVAERTQQLKEAQDQLLHAQKMEAIGQLAAGVAHDFNNLLTAIQGHAEVARATLPAGEPMRADLAEIIAAAERGASLTRQLLAFGRKQMLQPQLLDLNALVAEMHGMLRRLVGENIELRILEALHLGAVHADATQVQQVILNLVVNARDAMPDGGALTIETANVLIDEGFANAHAPMTPGPYVTMTVRDTGLGMDEQVKAHLFEPFFTTKGPGRGTGLGLATVYGIVKQSGGFIWCESAPGTGAEFRIYLPRAAPKVPEVEGTEAERTLGGTETVLVVEDEASVRNLACRVLAAHGYAVLAAPDGPEALNVVARQTEPIQVLVTDVVMPGMNGWELAERLRARLPDLKVLFVSGYPRDTIERSGGPPRGAQLLQKPYGGETLARRVRAVLDGAG